MNNTETLSLSNLVLQCTRPSGDTVEETAAVVVRDSPKLKLTAENVWVKGYVRSGILVLGGTQSSVPRTESTDVSGSLLKNVVVEESNFRSHCAAAMANFIGAIQIDASPYQTFIFQPSRGFPVPLLISSDPTARIVNVSRYTAVFGREYEQKFNMESDPPPSEATVILRSLSASLVVLFVLAVVLHGPRLYWYARYHSLQ